MDFRVEITDPAIDDLAEIVSYIAKDNPATLRQSTNRARYRMHQRERNPDVASALGKHLLDAALSLAQTPHKGSPYRHIGNVRKLTVQPFKSFYRVNETRQSVEVLRFWHSARREPKL